MTTSHFVWSRYTRHVPSWLRAGLLGLALACFAPSLVWAQFNVDNRSAKPTVLSLGDKRVCFLLHGGHRGTPGQGL